MLSWAVWQCTVIQCVQWYLKLNINLYGKLFSSSNSIRILPAQRTWGLPPCPAATCQPGCLPWHPAQSQNNVWVKTGKSLVTIQGKFIHPQKALHSAQTSQINGNWCLVKRSLSKLLKCAPTLCPESWYIWTTRSATVRFLHQQYQPETYKGFFNGPYYNYELTKVC